MFVFLATAAFAAGLVLPPGEAPDAWVDALALAGLAERAPAVRVRLDGGDWVLVVDGSGGPREARVAAPSTPRGREDVALLAASLLRPGPEVSLPVVLDVASVASSGGGGASPPATPPRAPRGPVVPVDTAAAAGERSPPAPVGAPSTPRPAPTPTGSVVSAAPVPVAAPVPAAAPVPVAAPVPAGAARLAAAPVDARDPVASRVEGASVAPDPVAARVEGASVAPSVAAGPIAAPTMPSMPGAAPSAVPPAPVARVGTRAAPDAAAVVRRPLPPSAAVYAGPMVAARGGVAPAPGLALGGVVDLASLGGTTLGAGLHVEGTVPVAPDVGEGSFGGARAALVVEVRGGGLARPFLAAGPGIAALFFDPTDGPDDPLQVAGTPGLLARAGAGWPLGERVRLELSVTGGTDLRPVFLARDGVIVGTIAAPWAGIGASARLR